MHVIPIGITSVDLKILSEFTKEHLGFSTLKNLDQAGLSPETLKAYLAACDFNPTATSKVSLNRSYVHFSITMAFHCHSDDYLTLQTQLPFDVTCTEAMERDTLVGIATANLGRWVDIIMICLRPDSTGALREFGDEVFTIFKRLNLEYIFNNVKKAKNNEGKTIFPV